MESDPGLQCSFVCQSLTGTLCIFLEFFLYIAPSSSVFCPIDFNYSASLNSDLLLNSPRPFFFFKFIYYYIPNMELKLTTLRWRVCALQTEPARYPKITMLCLGCFSLDFVIDMECVYRWKTRAIIGFPHLYPFSQQSEIKYCGTVPEKNYFIGFI